MIKRDRLAARRMSVPSTPASVAPSRETFVDALRGFALFGILAVNIMAFASPYYGLGIADPNFQSAFDNVVRFTISMLFETKFYLLFSFLFGYSFTLQMRAAERAGEPFVPRLLRRQAGLWLIGFLHAALLYHGDILTTYAVLGLVLLLLRNQPDTRLFPLALILVAGTALAWAGIGALAAVSEGGKQASAALAASAAAQAQTVLAAYTDTIATVIGQHLHEMSEVWVVIGLVQGPVVLAMFILGLIAGRRRLFDEAQPDATLLGRLLVGGVTIGLPGAVLYAYVSVCLIGSSWEIAALALSILTAPLLTGAYVAAIRLVYETETGKSIIRQLAPAGRMALTNYLMQSLICAVIFHAYGFRLMGAVSPPVSLGLAVAIFALQMTASRWWMDRFAYGPLEWLLRAITNARIPPMRKSGG